jgi:hypothetical protein
MKTVTLGECLDSIPDPREKSGQRFSLGAVLKLISVGLLSGRTSLNRIAILGKTLPPGAKKQLGFRGTTPCVATLSNILRRLDVKDVEKSMANYTVQGQRVLKPGTHIALDGKSLRGSHDNGGPMVHLLSAFIVKTKGVLGQQALEPGENEISGAIEFIKDLPMLEGTIISADAIFAQKKNLPSHY